MTTLTYELKASYAFIERNYNIIRRYWAWEIVWFTYSVVNALSTSYIGLGMERLSGQAVDGKALVLYLAVGTLVWRYLAHIFYWVTDVVGLERWEGTIEYTLMAPIHRLTHMVGQIAFAVVYSLVSTGLILWVTAAFFDLSLAQANYPGMTLVLLAGSFSFVGVSIVGSVLPLLFPERGSQMTHVIIALLLLISGVYYPVEVLPGWIQVVSRFSPATYVLAGVRAALIDGASVSALWPHLWPPIVMGFVTIPVGLQVFEWAERYAKKAGKLHRNG